MCLYDEGDTGQSGWKRAGCGSCRPSGCCQAAWRSGGATVGSTQRGWWQGWLHDLCTDSWRQWAAFSQLCATALGQEKASECPAQQQSTAAIAGWVAQGSRVQLGYSAALCCPAARQGLHSHSAVCHCENPWVAPAVQGYVHVFSSTTHSWDGACK